MDNSWRLVNFCEIDKYAAKSYCAIHGTSESLNLGDITKVDERKLPKFSLMTWGFPCTDISVAGKRKGFVDESGEVTRSGLYYEGLRIMKHCKSSVSVVENVKNLVGKKFIPDFKRMLKEFDRLGYNSYWKVLNAKDYGIPQNRERVFIISIKRELDNGKFVFPEPFDNGLRLVDLLEPEVDEKYYLSDKVVERLATNLNTGQLEQIGYINNYNGDANRVYSDGMARALKSEAGGGGAKTGWYAVNTNADGTSRTIKEQYYKTSAANLKDGKHCATDGIRVRKLTPKECFRLMGFSDRQFVRAEKVVSNTQLYKQAGNSIVVDVLYYIFRNLYVAMPYLFDGLRVLSLFSGIGAFETALNRLYGFESGNFTKPRT